MRPVRLTPASRTPKLRDRFASPEVAGRARKPSSWPRTRPGCADHYQVRPYDAWYRHITLFVLAAAFLAVTAHRGRQLDEKGRHHRRQASDFVVL